jgi:[ribosomal protein S5]-alanine N-acetyltransferase
MEVQHTVVEPLTLDRAEVLLEGSDAFTRGFGFRVADGYLEFPKALPATVQALRNGMDPRLVRLPESIPRRPR